MNLAICIECNEAIATFACRCFNPLVPLCIAHIGAHMEKASNEPHLLVPVTERMVLDIHPDAEGEDMKILFIQNLLRRCGNLKSEALLYIEERLAKLDSIQEQFNGFFEEVQCA
jgi:hypothetical protein